MRFSSSTSLVLFYLEIISRSIAREIGAFFDYLLRPVEIILLRQNDGCEVEALALVARRGPTLELNQQPDLVVGRVSRQTSQTVGGDPPQLGSFVRRLRIEADEGQLLILVGELDLQIASAAVSDDGRNNALQVRQMLGGENFVQSGVGKAVGRYWHQVVIVSGLIVASRHVLQLTLGQFEDGAWKSSAHHLSRLGIRKNAHCRVHLVLVFTLDFPGDRFQVLVSQQ